MDAHLRMFLLAGSLFILLFIARKIQKSAIKIADSIFWMLFSFILLIFAIFPEFVDVLADFFGFMATSNFVFAFVIGIILIKLFNNSREISQLNHKIETLTQEMALSDLKYRNELTKLKEESKETNTIIVEE